MDAERLQKVQDEIYRRTVVKSLTHETYREGEAEITFELMEFVGGKRSLWITIQPANVFVSIPRAVVAKAISPDPIQMLATLNEKPHINVRRELELIASHVHQAYHQSDTWRECGQGVCQRIQSLLDECPQGDDMNCVKCSIPIVGGTYTGGTGPYCPSCVPGQPQMGWICPLCKGVNAPTVKRCPCTPTNPQILTED